MVWKPIYVIQNSCNFLAGIDIDVIKCIANFALLIWQNADRRDQQKFFIDVIQGWPLRSSRLGAATNESTMSAWYESLGKQRQKRSAATMEDWKRGRPAAD